MREWGEEEEGCRYVRDWQGRGLSRTSFVETVEEGAIVETEREKIEAEVVERVLSVASPVEQESQKL